MDRVNNDAPRPQAALARRGLRTSHFLITEMLLRATDRVCGAQGLSLSLPLSLPPPSLSL